MIFMTQSPLMALKALERSKEHAVNVVLKRMLLVLLVLLSLPIVLPVYNPSLRLEGWGFLLGGIAVTISPLVLFGSLFYLVTRLW